MANFRTLAANTVADLVHRRVYYVVLSWGLIGAVVSLVVQGLVSRSGDAVTLLAWQALLPTTGLLVWSAVTAAYAGILGATEVAREVKTRTIVAVLARPVARWQLVVGKWLGIQIFILGLLAFETAVAAAAAWALDAPLWGVTPMRAAQMVVGVAWWSGVGASLGSLVHRDVALAGTAGLFGLPYLARPVLGDPSPVVAALAALAYHVGPAKAPGDLRNMFLDVLVVTRDPTFGLEATVLVENALYAAAALLLGCVWFARRDVRIR